MRLVRRLTLIPVRSIQRRVPINSDTLRKDYGRVCLTLLQLNRTASKRHYPALFERTRGDVGEVLVSLEVTRAMHSYVFDKSRDPIVLGVSRSAILT